jgi:hypothetical protein
MMWQPDPTRHPSISSMPLGPAEVYLYLPGYENILTELKFTVWGACDAKKRSTASLSTLDLH